MIPSVTSLDSTDSSIKIRVGDFNFKTLVFSDCLNQFHINTSVYWFWFLWNKKGAKRISLAMIYLLNRNGFFNHARVCRVGTAEDDEAVHFLIILSRLPSFFIWEGFWLNCIQVLVFTSFFHTESKTSYSFTIHFNIWRSWPWLMAYSITGLSSIMASMAPALKLLY